ncbi:unnamed protein product (macronuclear) [Paramecium tetraurelia]|uniref:Chromosome undetermined scaffold_1, whole genome shotgun sequence n=1 Tax=Paramecium tetraurelia TaxID=5888 RepID=Q6BG70_PARTE|nr:hypothetical protein [Paramecium tetraurelia strain d4-2]XP_001423341.1 uncharacterized protein GSPATT00000378001 [Paramecium tetraurelia]CAH03350.1 hypothetical protein PTMB.152c [Paramecium tetraurelia]CAK55943.1 unnamed protein product [Paramecium tetraurelia]|eukprot:XP_001423341.1 hypothetical protein (macronuclear) [Paramecium tetraurelia strain d4-2]
MQQFQTSILDKDMLLQTDGSLYVGTIIRGNLQGFGLLINPDGSYYYGEFKDSEPINIGIYKLQNSCIKLHFDDNSNLIDSENIHNKSFLYKVIPFKNNSYGDKILIKRFTNMITYGLTKKGEYDGFCVQHYKNGDTFYGQIIKGKREGDAIEFKSKKQQWFWLIYKEDVVQQQKFYGDNFVPRDLITELFGQIHNKIPNHSRVVSLANIQFNINNIILNMNLENSIKEEVEKGENKGARQFANSFEEDQVQFDDNEQFKELQEFQNDNLSKLTQTEIEQAKIRIGRSTSCLVSSTDNPQCTSNIRDMVKTKIIIKRSTSPILTTIRPLFSVIRV